MSDLHTLVVSVAQCDLRRARFPLAVGHYPGDVIVSAEADLDAALGGVLGQHFGIGNYPGEIGTSEIVLQRKSNPPGAIVVGLGKVGALTTQRLRDVLSAALKKYALRCLHASERDGQPVAANLSTVLIGTDGGSFGSVPDSVHTIVRAALDANRALQELNLFEQVRINEVEFIELYEDVAIHAAQVVAALPGPLSRELRPTETVVGDQTMRTYEGGRFLRPTSPYTVGWWQRIAVRGKGGASTSTSEAATALQFSVLTDRARIEQDVSVTQRTLIQQIVATATTDPVFKPENGAALYQLLVPEAVKDRIRTGGNLLFMVDRAGAGYPFELMAERDGNDFRPLIEKRGILRQFETEILGRGDLATASQIFVVGNPKTILWSNLPGAQREADEVARVAAAKGLLPVRPPRDNPEETVTTLVTGEYRILHLAAHGQFDPDPLKSGVVVGDRIFITPAEILAMPAVPEFVFLNCCYLGAMDAARQGGPDPRLAASLAEGFIQAGVRAIVAAGWAVDDDAGCLFATEFYSRFLDGAPFGQAIAEARRTTREQYGNNTWGAYQCYGNPEYSFRRVRPAVSPPREVTVVARSEALQALRTLVGDARRVRLEDVSGLRARFEQLEQAMGARWGADGEILHACGQICGELGDFDKAIDFYDNALRSASATAPIVAAEQLVNLLARAAARPDSDPTAAAKRKDHFDRASKLLTWLDAQIGKSAERSNIRGSLFKRRALWEPDRRRACLKRALAAYKEARTLSGDPGYSGLNAYAVRFALTSKHDIGKLRRDVDAFYEELTQRHGHGPRDFWYFAEPGDALLLRGVIRGSLDAATVDDVLKAYESARKIGPTPREWASVCDQVTFLAAMTRDANLPSCNLDTAAALDTILASLTPHPAAPVTPQSAANGIGGVVAS